MDLKKTVEQQIDVIIKLQQERKALVRQNKLYKQKNKQLTLMANKYNLKAETKERLLQTDQLELVDIGIQIQLEVEHVSHVSQLNQAKQLLNCLNKTQFKSSFSKEIIQQTSTHTINTISNKSKKPQKNDEVLSSQIVKMTKQINSLRKDLKDSLKIIKTKDIQIKQVRKCLEVKTELLQKSRTEFNELSKIVNTDKYKSVKILQQQSCRNRQNLKSALQEIKILKYEQQKVYGLNQKLKMALQGLTIQYQNYKTQNEKNKQEQGSTVQTMKLLVQKYKEQARQYQKNQKHLLQSIRKCQCKLQ